MTTLKITAIGDQQGVILPPEVLQRLQADGADEVKLIDTPHGAILQRVDAETVDQIEIAVDVMERRRDALRRLAE